MLKYNQIYTNLIKNVNKICKIIEWECLSQSLKVFIDMTVANVVAKYRTKSSTITITRSITQK